MERIREAIELAKARGVGLGSPNFAERRNVPLPESNAALATGVLPTFAIDEAIFESMRIVAHQPANRMTPAFDILRTSVLQLMDANGWQTIAISSPTPGCGKTVTAINLAFSIARMPGRQVVLLDLDMRRPLVGSYLGVKPRGGVFELLSGTMKPEDCMAHMDVSGPQLTVIPNRTPVANAAEVISSKELSDLLSQLKGGAAKPIVVIDTPPMLMCDDVLALLPSIDCIALAVAEKMSKADEITACERHLKSVNYLGLVLTKSTETRGRSYY